MLYFLCFAYVEEYILVFGSCSSRVDRNDVTFIYWFIVPYDWWFNLTKHNVSSTGKQWMTFFLVLVLYLSELTQIVAVSLSCCLLCGV